MTTTGSIIASVCEALEGDDELAGRLRAVIGIEPRDRWLTVDRAAADLGIEPRVITDDARRGRIVLGHAGRTPMVQQSELDRWIGARPASVQTAPAATATDAGRSAVERAAKRWTR